MQNKTTRVNVRFDEYDVYMGRPGNGQDGYFGNPFPLKLEESRGSTLAKFRQYFVNRIKTDTEFKNRIHELEGKRLACFCGKNSPCHVDVIISYINYIKNMPNVENVD